MYMPVWQRIVVGHYTQQPGVVSGFERRAVLAQQYPVLIDSDAVNAQVAGVVYFKLARQDLMRLDHFEGRYYVRRLVPVTLESGEVIQAQTYVLNPKHRRIVSDKPWNEARFESQGLKKFLANYKGWF